MQSVNTHSYLLVAESSVLPVIDCVVQSIEKHGAAGSITIVVPRAQQERFRIGRSGHHLVLAEDDLLPDWPISRLRSVLHKQSWRAGWYLQQFLKLSFGCAAGMPQYVAWDADTVMLKRPDYCQDGQVLMNTSREYHRPYFETFQRLFSELPILSRSAIAQYMPIDTQIVREMITELEQRHQCTWVEAILRAMPGISASEFSEYETYANYYAIRHPGSVRLTNRNWFRYGSYIVPETLPSLREIENRFSGYSYVAFERHRGSHLKKLLALALCSVRL